jgi:uncharacterized membrane protein
MPAFTVPFLGFILGLAFAWTASEELASDPTSVLGSRCWVLTTLFSVLTFAPAAAYFLVFHGDWAMVYLVNSQRLPSAIILALVLLDAAMVPLGFMMGAPLARQRKMKNLLTMAAGPAFIVLVLVLVSARRIGVSATYTQFHGDFGVSSIAGTPLGYAIVWVNGVLAAAAVLTFRQLRKLSVAAAPEP